MLYEQGRVDTSLPFAELRARSDVTARAKACGDRDDFSRCIREGLPTPAADGGRLGGPAKARREERG